MLHDLFVWQSIELQSVRTCMTKGRSMILWFGTPEGITILVTALAIAERNDTLYWHVSTNRTL